MELVANFKKDTVNQFDIIVPTMGSLDLIVPAIERILFHTKKSKFKLVVVNNPTSKGKAEAALSKKEVEKLCSEFNSTGSNGIVNQCVELNWLDMDSPAGWVGAVNFGLFSILHFAPTVIIMNDDVIVTNKWAEKLDNALNTDRIWFESKVDLDGGYYESDGDSIASYGRVGAVGPLSTQVAGQQSIQQGDIQGNALEFYTHGAYKVLDDFVRSWEPGKSGRVLNTDFLSGFCVAYKRECIEELVQQGEDGHPFFLDPHFGIGGYDDNDVAARADQSGWKLGVASDCYVHHKGHQTLDKHFPELERGLANVGPYVEKWGAVNTTDKKIIGCMRVKLNTMHDVGMFYECVRRNSQMIDGLAVLMTGNPYEVTQAFDWNGNALDPNAQKMIASCGEASSPQSIANAVKVWLESAVSENDHDVPVITDTWHGKFNERDERNKSIEMAESLDADWVFSIDHDEFLEDRVDRQLFRRLIAHPNPLVKSFDFGWLNHWDTTRVCRVDAPWCNGYVGGMHGARLWKVNKSEHAKGRITGGRTDGENDVGLHCGNSPDFTVLSRRVSGIRFRHFGYIRHADRIRKHQFYTTIDPNPNMVLTGGGYSHLVDEENMKLSPYVAHNGIAFSMLLHKADQIGGLYRFLDHTYALCDQIVLVWTGPKGTKPPESMKTVAKAFGASWVYKPFNNDLAEVRNAGLDHIRETKREATRWFFTMDDDEHLRQDFMSCLSLRRMAECSNTWGWMLKFRNWRDDGTFNYSETIRMFLIDPNGVMKYANRVHESVEASILKIKNMGLHPQVRFAPFEVDHIGLGLSKDQMQAKLEFYTKLLEMQLLEDPTNTGGWCSLGLQFMNDGQTEEARICFQNSVAVAGDSYLGFRELATWHLRQAFGLLIGADERLSPAHPVKELLHQQLAFLKEFCPPFPVSGSASEGNPIKTNVDLQALQESFIKAMSEIASFDTGDTELQIPDDFGGTVVESTENRV